jgi:hypothetical protein
MVEGDRTPGRRTLGKIRADGIVDIEFALRLQDEDRHCGELLGDGAEPEAGFQRVGKALLLIRHPIRLLEHNVAIAPDEHYASEEVNADEVVQVILGPGSNLGRNRGGRYGH